MSKRTSWLIAGLAALVLAMVTLLAALSIVGTGATERIAQNEALAGQPVGEAFVRSVALIDQAPAGYVAASGPGIGQSVFPGEALARSLALTGQAWAGYMVANEPKAPATGP